MDSKEVWKFIYFNAIRTRYKVSSLGRFFSLRNGHIKYLTPKCRYRGYIVFCLKLENGKEYRQSAHRLVAKAFIKNPNNYTEVLHGNDIKDDNRVSNLSWGTKSKNTQDAYDRGMAKGRKGEDHHNCKLTNSYVLSIFNSKKSVKEISENYGVSQSSVYEIKSGTKWNHITGKKYKRFLADKKTVLDIFKSKMSVQKICVKYNVTENTVTGIKKGEYWKSITGAEYSCKKRLTREQVLNIYNSKKSAKKLADMYGVKYNSIWRIKSGIYWSEITGHPKYKLIQAAKEGQ